MEENVWIKEFPAAVTVCDPSGIILEMNGRSRVDFEADGGEKLIGRSILDCHPEPSRTKLKTMMDERRANIYTVQKKGKKKLICQAPWYKDGAYAGFVEISLEIPWDMPHFNRDK